jgi:hypothetical protein
VERNAQLIMKQKTYALLNFWTWAIIGAVIFGLAISVGVEGTIHIARVHARISAIERDLSSPERTATVKWIRELMERPVVVRVPYVVVVTNYVTVPAPQPRNDMSPGMIPRYSPLPYVPPWTLTNGTIWLTNTHPLYIEPSITNYLNQADL